MTLLQEDSRKRPGAGRKPNLAKMLLKGVSRNTILAAVENVDVGSIITGLLGSKREQTRMETSAAPFDWSDYGSLRILL